MNIEQIMALADEYAAAASEHIISGASDADDARAALEAALTEKQEPVAWRYHVVSPWADKDGMYKVSDRWTLIDKPDQRDAHSACCDMEAYPLYTADQLAGAVLRERERCCDVLLNKCHDDMTREEEAAAIRGQT